jgi:CheY-like chemotaxis protein
MKADTPLQKPFALVVEDHPDNALLFAEALNSAGYETEIAREGQRALDRLAQVAPALVLLDLELPRVSGAQILRHIRSDKRLAQVKVILTTASDHLAGPLAQECDLVLLKPISFSQLSELAARFRHAS